VSPCSTTPESLSDSASSDEVDDLEIDEVSNLSDNHGVSVSMASLYSEADVLKRPRGAPDGASDIFSAEGVALSLISKFSEKQLPRASDLEWLVSEEDAPQALLPMPKSWPVSPDESTCSSTLLRGTQEWAPPRPQIIFTIHPPPS
jgi:run domain Beclin-1 interacting cysteine-rich containing protein